MIESKKGGVFGFIILAGLFLFIFVIAFAPVFNETGAIVQDAGVQGTPAFFLMNIQLWILLAFVISVSIYFTLGGG